jgi:hypothetical protein
MRILWKFSRGTDPAIEAELSAVREASQRSKATIGPASGVDRRAVLLRLFPGRHSGGQRLQQPTPELRVRNGGICDLSCATAAGQNTVHQVVVLPPLPSPGLHARNNGMNAYRQIVLAS